MKKLMCMGVVLCLVVAGCVRKSEKQKIDELSKHRMYFFTINDSNFVVVVPEKAKALLVSFAAKLYRTSDPDVRTVDRMLGLPYAAFEIKGETYLLQEDHIYSWDEKVGKYHDMESPLIDRLRELFYKPHGHNLEGITREECEAVFDKWAEEGHGR